MIGGRVDQYPAAARDVAAVGHLIISRTWQHLDLPALGEAAALARIDQVTADRGDQRRAPQRR